MSENTTTAPTGPTQDAYNAACAALWAHRDRADRLAAALDEIRAWRHLQAHTAGPELTPLDAILDAVSVDEAAALPVISEPTSLQEAVTAYREVMNARRRTLAASRLVWDQIEQSAIRMIDRHMPHGKAQPTTRDCPSCEAGIEHTEHCPTPETHNWGCGCLTDQAPRNRA